MNTEQRNIPQVSVTLVREALLPYGDQPMASGLDVHRFLQAALQLGDRATETFVVMGLNARNQAVGVAIVAVGGTTECHVQAAEVFRPVLLMGGACRVIVAHNHPSGDATPSRADVALTDRLVQAGELLGLPMLDHVICGAKGYCSLMDPGLMEKSA